MEKLSAVYSSFAERKLPATTTLGTGEHPYGKLFYAYKRHLNETALEEDPLGELERLYKLGSQLASDDETALEECREELVKLQLGDPDAIALWERVNELSIDGLREIYDLLDVHFDCFLGESFYRDQVERVYEELQEAGLAEESEGARGISSGT